MDEKSGRVVPKTKTSKNAFSPVGEEEYRNLISKLTFYDFDALDVVDGVNLVVSFKQSDIPRFCDVVEGYCIYLHTANMRISCRLLLPALLIRFQMISAI